MDKNALIAEIASLKKRKKFGLVWEDKPEQAVSRCQEELPVLHEVKSLAITAMDDKPTNLLIEGDNYHALAVLNYTHKGKVDVIYIDPPYNTGAKDWKYNNSFVDKTDGYRHSKWLSMMAHRLTLAKNLLAEDGVLICAIDENEFNRLGLLLEDIFEGHKLHCITIVHNPRGIIGTNFSYTNEYAVFVLPPKGKVIGPRVIPKEKIQWRGLRDNGGESLRTDARNCFYPIVVDSRGAIIGFGDVVSSEVHPKLQTENIGGKFYVYPIDNQGVERKWRYARQSVECVKHMLRADRNKGGDKYDVKIGKEYGTVRTVWWDKLHDSNEYGTKIVNTLVRGSGFNFPKSVFNVYDCVAPILRARKEAIVLDFFAGSGTTGHAVALLNKEDGGDRIFILCTNNENEIARKVCFPRIKAVIKGHEDLPEITGIASNLRYFKTAFVAAASTDKNKIRLAQKAADMLCVKEGTFMPVKLVKTYKIFRNGKHYTAIIYDPKAISAVKKFAAMTDGKFVVYIFSLSDEDFADEFADMHDKIMPRAIPEAIMRVCRQIFSKGKQKWS